MAQLRFHRLPDDGEIIATRFEVLSQNDITLGVVYICEHCDFRPEPKIRLQLEKLEQIVAFIKRHP